jgi:hypothetical protein
LFEFEMKGRKLCCPNLIASLLAASLAERPILLKAATEAVSNLGQRMIPVIGSDRVPYLLADRAMPW